MPRQTLFETHNVFRYSVYTASSVRAFLPSLYIGHKAILDGPIGAGFENPKEASHGGHGGHGGLRFTIRRSPFGVRSLRFGV
jgi:hypothetical protein